MQSKRAKRRCVHMSGKLRKPQEDQKICSQHLHGTSEIYPHAAPASWPDTQRAAPQCGAHRPPPPPTPPHPLSSGGAANRPPMPTPPSRRRRRRRSAAAASMRRRPAAPHDSAGPAPRAARHRRAGEPGQAGRAWLTLPDAALRRAGSPTDEGGGGE